MIIWFHNTYGHINLGLEGGVIIRNFLKYYFPPSSPKTWFIFYFRLNSPSTLISHRSGARAEKKETPKEKQETWPVVVEWSRAWCQQRFGSSWGEAVQQARALARYPPFYLPTQSPTYQPTNSPTHLLYIYCQQFGFIGKRSLQKTKATILFPPTPRAKTKVSVSVKKEWQAGETALPWRSCLPWGRPREELGATATSWGAWRPSTTTMSKSTAVYSYL